MRVKYFVLVFAWVLFYAGTSPVPPEVVRGDLNILPLPASMTPGEGVFLMDPQMRIQAEGLPPLSFTPWKVFSEVLNRKSGYDPFLPALLNTESPSQKYLKIVWQEPLSQEGQYTLSVTADEIRIQAGTAEGIFYALQSLRQMMRMDAMPDFKGKQRYWMVPTVWITDQPVFSYRGMHLDVCRHMMPVAFVKKYIDLLSLYKMNRFHWHLTDDQGWRIEIKKYPRLQEVAAWRDQTLVGHYNEDPDRYDGKRYGGYYTQEQIKEVVAYARERGVMVIPEIEMPGHSLAAIAAYPSLACQPGPFKVGETWGVFDDVYCPREETFRFLEGVLDEVTALFPGPYIHVGGDECPKKRWQACPHCQALMAREGLTDEMQLQSYFIRRIESYVEEKGKRIIGWDEILEGGLAPHATVMSWNGIQGGVEAAKAGHDVIMTPTSHCYFDYYQAAPLYEPLAIGGLIPLYQVYSFQPVPEGLARVEAKHILGGQGNLWTEYITTPEQAEYMAYPRAIAMAEVLWTPKEKRNWNGFMERLIVNFKLLDALDVHYSRSILNPTVNITTVAGQLQLSWNTVVAAETIYFSQDTSHHQWSIVYPGESYGIRDAGPVFYKTTHSKVFRLDFNPSKSAEANLLISPQPHENYHGRQWGATLNDGLRGTSDFNGQDWCAWKEPFVIRIQFARETEVDTIRIGTLMNPGSWIHAPEKVGFLGRDSAGEATWGGMLKPTGLPGGRNELVMCTGGIKVFELVLEIQPVAKIPPGLPGAGQPAWTFIDEVEVK